MDIYRIKERSVALSKKTETGSITPEEVGGIFSDVIDFLQQLRTTGATLGIRKVYSSVQALRADNDPLDADGFPVKKGNLVTVFDPDIESEDNNKVFARIASGWLEVGRLNAGTTNDYTDADKAKVDILVTNGSATRYLAEDGQYHEIVIPEAPLQGVRVNGTPVHPDAHGVIDIETGKGTVQSIIFNDVKMLPDTSGNVVLKMDVVEVDDSLSPDSSNAVSNAAVSERIAEIEGKLPAGMEAVLSGDESKVTLSLLDKEGRPFASAEIPAGKGGTGDVNATRISLVASVDKTHIKQGDAVQLTYAYDHLNADNSSTGARADITLLVKRGAQTLYEDTIQDVSKGVYTFDVTKYLAVGSTDIYVKASVRTEDGKTQIRQAYASVRSYALSLSTSYNMSAGVVGYAPADNVEIPFAVSGVGNKQVFLYVDGVEKDTRTVTKSGLTNGTFMLPMSALIAGKHSVQMVAVMSVGDLTVRSESIYFELYKGISNDTAHVCVKFNRRDGGVSATSVVNVSQYENFEFSYAVYHPSHQPADVTIHVGSDAPILLSVGRTVQSHTTKFISAGAQKIEVSCAGISSVIDATVIPSSVQVEEVVDGRVLYLSARGRSNSEQNPAIWGDAMFVDPDFSAGGWTGDALLLVNGAGINIPHRLFENDATQTGATLEIEFLCKNIIDKEASLISCIYNEVGFEIKAQEAMMRTAGGAEVSTKFASDMFFRIAFVVRKKTDGRLIEIFVNGIRCGAVQYGVADTLMQTVAQGITVSSVHADLSLRAVSVYTRALSDDEVLNNYIATRTTPGEIVSLHAKNDVLGDDGMVSIEKLRAQGKSVMRIVGNVELLNQTNNKKFEIPVDVYFYSAFGKEYDFILRQGGMRIQGTSSTTYPRKNYRIYFDRKKKYNTTLEIGGVVQEVLKYTFKPGALPVSLFTLKADFAESSSTHNTGLARIINDVFFRAGILTPPQRIESKVRIGIDGFPMDAFYDNNASNVNKYLGKYNFNNDKSASAEVFGFSGETCTCLEFLNNSYPLGLFDTDDMSGFADALEFRYPEDLTWEDADSERKNAIQRLWTWIRGCKGNPDKFRREVAQYFDVDNLFAWYLITEYFMMCDQRVKNMMLATWDGRIWYFIPYDNDTVLGVRNDGKLKYDYTITEDSYDSSASTYCFAGHDSVLWNLVRQMPDKMMDVAQKLRASMSKEYVLDVLNNQQMSNWSERIYNKDGDFKYLQPLRDSGIDYLYSLQGSRYAHRSYIVDNRFALLDARYLAGTYRADNLRLYFSHKFSTDHKNMYITASERYYFGYGYTSGMPRQSGVLAEQAGSKVALTLDSDLIVNDPQFVYGASRFRELDLKEVSAYIVNNVNFANCSRLKKIDMSSIAGNTTLTGIVLAGCDSLEELNLRGIRSTAFRTLDLSTNARLKILDAGDTLLTDIILARGAKIERIVYPLTTSILQLRGFKHLTLENLVLQGKSNISRLWFEDCPKIDWEALYATLPAVTHLRVTGINKTGDTAWLLKFLDKGGINENGSLTDTCALVGTYMLDKYISEEELARLQAHFPELSIRQPEYTTIKWFEKDMMSGLLVDVADPENIQNMDNQTGYGTNRAYQPSGHLQKIFSKRHRVLGKQEKKGEMCIYPLHDKNSYFFADAEDVKNASAAKLDGTEGDIYMYEPAYWYKGINDYENGCCYGVFSSNIEKPRVPAGKKITYSELVKAGQVQGSKFVHKDPVTVDESLQNFVSRAFSVAKVDVEGWKYINFTYAIDYSAIDTKFANDKISHMFVDEQGNILKKFNVTHLHGNNGCNTVLRIPENAKYFYITFCYTFASDAHDYIWLTNSDSPQDWECEWIRHDEKLVSIAQMNVVDGKPRCIVTAEKQLVNKQTELVYNELLNAHSLRRLSYTQHKNISVLIYAKYGTRNTGVVRMTGAYVFTYPRQEDAYNLNHLAEFGMQDTDFYDAKNGISASKFPRYLLTDELGVVSEKKSEHAAILGYIDYPLQTMYNDYFRVKEEENAEYIVPGTYRGWLTSFEENGRKIPLMQSGGSYTRAIVWGRQMDVIQRGTAPALSDKFFLSYSDITRTDKILFGGFSMHDRGCGVSVSSMWNILTSYDRVSICEFSGAIRHMSSVSEFQKIEQYKWLK